MKAISFIGLGTYDEVTYFWQTDQGEDSYRTHLFPEAVARIFQPERLLVLVTTEARRHANFLVLQERLGNLVQPVLIPSGSHEQELWQIFDRCVSVVEEGDEILLDVTHAFRSLPLVVFTAAAYLRRAKGTSIRYVIYGAHDAAQGNEKGASDSRRVPIFNLTPIVDLLDWLSGAESFLFRSDAFALAEKLEATHRRLWTSRTSDGLPTSLQNLAQRLRNLSLALHLAWPRDVMIHAHELLPTLDRAIEEIRRWSPPFAVIIEHVRRQVEPLAHPRPDDLDIHNLKRQLALIEHYLSKGLIVQAVNLMREWIVNWVVFQRARTGHWLSRDERQEAEKALGASIAHLMDRSTTIPEWFASISRSEDAAEIWSLLAELRNAVAHCAMSEDRPNPRTVESTARAIASQLPALLENVTDRVLHGRRRLINLKDLYGEVAKQEELNTYVQQALEMAGEGNDVVLTGQAPVWLYLAVAHALHGKARRLIYSSPVTGEIVVFDHAAR